MFLTVSIIIEPVITFNRAIIEKVKVEITIRFPHLLINNNFVDLNLKFLYLLIFEFKYL